jgi:hypothetical protein
MTKPPAPPARVLVLVPEGAHEYAQQALAHALGRGEAPLVPESLYRGVAVTRAIAATRQWVESAVIIAVYSDRGLTPNMVAMADYGRSYRLRVEHRWI